jgi:hypothetical protein
MRWPWQMRRDRQAKDALREWFDYDRKAETEGFVLWTARHPEPGTWIEAQRREWPARRAWQSGNERPWFNVGGLWWRPWHGETIEGDVIDQKAVSLDVHQ